MCSEKFKLSWCQVESQNLQISCKFIIQLLPNEFPFIVVINLLVFLDFNPFFNGWRLLKRKYALSKCVYWGVTTVLNFR